MCQDNKYVEFPITANFKKSTFLACHAGFIDTFKVAYCVLFYILNILINVDNNRYEFPVEPGIQ